MYFAEGLDVNEYEIDALERSMTYYWRVDEVNNPASSGKVTGNVWSFSTEPIGYAIEPDSIVDVNVSGQTLPGFDPIDPNVTVNEAGLDANDMHTTDPNHMWSSQASDGNNLTDDVWIKYEFDKVYKFWKMMVWNYNEQSPSNMSGAKTIKIEYSIDDVNWAVASDDVVLTQATGTPEYGGPDHPADVVDMNEINARYIRIVIKDSFFVFTNYGLSEVRFFRIPMRAYNMDPEDEDTGIDPNGLELTWKPGRYVEDHYIYIGTDFNDVNERLVDVIEWDDSSYEPTTVGLTHTYYWAVDEVNEADETYSTWEGVVQSFTTIASVEVDDFGSYDDYDANGTTIWQTWKSGWDDAEANGGSTTGNQYEPYSESEIVYSAGGQSGPMQYDNTGSYDFSQIVANPEDLPIGTTEWSLWSPTTMTLWMRFDVNAVFGDEEIYCEINGVRQTYQGDPTEMIDKELWMQFDYDLTADGVDLDDVDEIVIGIRIKDGGTTGSKSILYLDDIVLTGLAPITASETYLIEAEDFVDINGPMEVNDVFEGASGPLAQYIHPTEGTDRSSGNPPAEGFTTYEVDLPAGQYVIYGRVSIPDSFWSDAFWFTIDGASTDPELHESGWAGWNGITHGEDWHWVPVWHATGYQGGTTVTWTIPGGVTTIKVAYRDLDGTTVPKLDALFIVKVGD
jgi:hypothetical protein